MEFFKDYDGVKIYASEQYGSKLHCCVEVGGYPVDVFILNNDDFRVFPLDLKFITPEVHNALLWLSFEFSQFKDFWYDCFRRVPEFQYYSSGLIPIFSHPRREGIASFEKVSMSQFEADCKNSNIDCNIISSFCNILIPKRGTRGSACYDFATPIDIDLAPGDTIRIPTGIRCKMSEGWFLQVFPRSGMGVKYRIQLDNTVGIIDGDYYYADNEGHILLQVTNDGKKGKSLSLKAGDRFCQGFFSMYGTVVGDDATVERSGGFGSTGV